jgi:ABC-type polysaccharide/polyol phosphate export permease/Flp pilus assembly protein TadD
MAADGPAARRPAARRLTAAGQARLRRLAEAAPGIRAAAEAAPGDPVAWLRLGRARWLVGDAPGAQAAARQALRLQPGLLRAHLLLARIAEAHGRHQQVLAHLRDAVGHAPLAAALRARLAAAQLRRGQPDTALRTAREALGQDPGCDAASLVVAQCHLARGDATRAGLVLSRLQRARPDWPELREILAALPGAAAPPEPVAEPVAEPGAVAAAPAALVAERRVRPAPDLRAAPAMAPRRPRPTLPEAGLVEHLFILRALMLRNLRQKYRANPLGLLLELVRPITVVVAHYALFEVVNKPMPAEIPVVVFVLAGFSVWFAFNFSAQGALGGGRWPAGAVHLPGVTLMHVRLARALWPLLVNFSFCLLALLPAPLWGGATVLPDLPLTALVFAIAGTLGFGFALCVERLEDAWPAFRPIEKLLNWGLFVTCGLYFSINHVLPVLAGVFLFNPVLHLVEFERHAFDPGYPLRLVSLAYPATLAVGLLLAGLAAGRRLTADAAG